MIVSQQNDREVVTFCLFTLLLELHAYNFVDLLASVRFLSYVNASYDCSSHNQTVYYSSSSREQSNPRMDERINHFRNNGHRSNNLQGRQDGNFNKHRYPSQSSLLLQSKLSSRNPITNPIKILSPETPRKWEPQQ